MPRQNVQDSDILNFRERLDAYGRRQSVNADGPINARKRRTEPGSPGIGSVPMRHSESWQGEDRFTNKKRQRSIPTPYAEGAMFRSYSSPRVPTTEPHHRRELSGGLMISSSDITHRSSFDLYRSRPSYSMTADDTSEDLTMTRSADSDDRGPPSTLASSELPSPYSSEPRTPDQPFFEPSMSEDQPAEFITVGSPMDGNLLMAMHTRAAAPMGEKVQRVHGRYGTGYEEFMNIS